MPVNSHAPSHPHTVGHVSPLVCFQVALKYFLLLGLTAFHTHCVQIIASFPISKYSPLNGSLSFLFGGGVV